MRSKFRIVEEGAPDYLASGQKRVLFVILEEGEKSWKGIWSPDCGREKVERWVALLKRSAKARRQFKETALETC